MNIQASFLQGEWEKFIILSLVYESIGALREEHRELKTDVHICRPFVVGFVDGERVHETNSSKKHHIRIFVREVGPLF